MVILLKKALREIWEYKGAYVACIFVIAFGVMSMTSFVNAFDSLGSARDAFYLKNDFAEAFAEVRSFPIQDLTRIKAVNGIDKVNARIIKDARVEVMTNDTVYLRLVSYDAKDTSGFNTFTVESGLAKNQATGGIWTDGKFFKEHGLSIGGHITLIANGRKADVLINGTASSPEFIYPIRTASDLFPDPKTFGIAFIDQQQMKNVFGFGGGYNSLAFSFDKGVEFIDVKNILEDKLDRYGMLYLIPRKDQASNLVLDQELRQLNGMSKSLPVLFFMVAALILYFMLSRTVENQRGQIGILMALGYSKKTIMLHYLAVGMVVTAIGAILGAAIGFLLSGYLIGMYDQYFHIPGMKNQFSWVYAVISMGVMLGFSLVSGLHATRKVLRMTPAGAMRQVAPVSGRHIFFIEDVALIWSAFTAQGKMGVRNIFRSPGRSLFVFLGVCLTTSMLVATLAMWKTSEKVLLDHYKYFEVYDGKLNLASPLQRIPVLREIAREKGVDDAEARLDVPVKVYANGREKAVLLQGLPVNVHLFRPGGKDFSEYGLPDGSLLLSENIASKLGVVPGDAVEIKYNYYSDKDSFRSMTVYATYPQYMGMGMLMTLGSLQNMLGYGDIANTFMFNTNDGNAISRLNEKFGESGAVAGIEDQKYVYEKTQTLMATYVSSIYIMIIICLFMGFAIIYNAAIVGFNERKKEIATLILLGYSLRESVGVLTFEQWAISLVALPLGIPLGKLWIIAMSRSVDNDIYTYPTTLGGEAMLLGIVFSVISIIIAHRLAFRKIKDMHLAEVVKAED